MWTIWKKNWRLYLIEAWALGMFMLSACFFTILIEHPALPIRNTLGSPVLWRLAEGLAMGLTAVLLIYSKWGKRSGAHMNPAVTLTFYQLDRIEAADAAGYISAQFAGGLGGILVSKWLAFSYLSHPAINFVVTRPGVWGEGWALALETGMAFTLFLTVLWSSNHPRLASYTGIFAGLLLVFFITFEAPYSGMSINPARTTASALPAGVWTAWWLYFIGPVAGMNAAGFVFRRWYRMRHNGNCLTMECHFSGVRHGNGVYKVLRGRDGWGKSA